MGNGVVGTGLARGAEELVRDALDLVEGAAKDAPRREEELPRYGLADIARRRHANRKLFCSLMNQGSESVG